MKRLLAAGAVWLLLGGAAFAASDDVLKPLGGSPDGHAACTDDPALVSGVKVYDPSCTEGTKSLKNQPERDPPDMPPKGGATDDKTIPEEGGKESVPRPAPGANPM